jgi:hypothetical protein
MHPDQFAALSRILASSASRRTLYQAIGAGAVAWVAVAIGRDETVAGKHGKHKRKGQHNGHGHAGGAGSDLTGMSVRGNAKGRAFTGTLDVVRFKRSGGRLVAVGKLTGQITDATGAVLHDIDRTVQLPVRIPGQTAGALQAQQCSVLHLELAPVTIVLFGVPVTVGGIVVDVTSDEIPAPFGDLLCAILGGGGLSLDQLVALLNQLLGQFGGA